MTKHAHPEEKGCQTETPPIRWGGGCTKMDRQNRQRISLAWLSVHGTRDTFSQTSETRDPGINRLDQIAKQHDIDYSRAKNLQDKWKADTKMIQAIDRLPGKKTKTERVVKKIMQAKKRLKL